MTSQPLLPRERGGPGASASATTNTEHTTDSTRRRSRNGCLTCKRRKVRCNEQRPRCYHCQRLRFDCVWKESTSTQSAAHSQTAQPSNQSQSQPSAQQHAQQPATTQVPMSDSPHSDSASAVSAAASASVTASNSNTATGDSNESPNSGLFDFAQSVVDGTLDLSSFQDIYFPPVSVGGLGGMSDFSSMPMAGITQDVPDQQAPQQEWLLSAPAPTQSPPQTDAHGAVVHTTVAEAPLPLPDIDLSLDLPPILDPIENGPKCASVKALFHRMATASPMFRAALSAFATIQASTTAARVQYKRYYDQAAAALGERVDASESSATATATGARIQSTKTKNDMRHVLATIFFLTYINLLTGQLEMACANLEKAHRVIQLAGGVGALGSVDQRIVSWIRLLDARAASAGGQGLLVNDTSGIIYPLTPSTSPGESGAQNAGERTEGTPETSSAHEVIYEMLCQPGIVFYQEVQTLTVRITRIAHAHRSRGSVEDETEVMAIAATILKDLQALYARRPAIMDAAVGESSDSDSMVSLLAPSLASAIVRSYQTYLANFYACYIHLHRVAHRHLARSQTMLTAMEKIKQMVHAMVDNSANDGEKNHIMVNMLWPLFLWGSEEDDADECRWILKTIRSLHHLVTNANMTANVLQEIQTRQQEAGWRVDIRSVCLELFNTTFAIV